MTPARLLALVGLALGRKPTVSELDTWGSVLVRTLDDDADAGLVLHRSTSPHAPTPSDVRRAAVGIANDRAMRAQAERLRLEQQTGRVHDPADPERHGKPLVPMTDEARAALREFTARQAARQQTIEEPA